MPGESSELWMTTPPLLSLTLSLSPFPSLFISFPLLVFEASETPPCVHLHSIPWAAQA